MIANVFYIVILEILKINVTTNLSRVSKKDLLIAEEIIDECNMDLENVSLDELDKIENLLKVNIHIFGCNKNFNSKKLLNKVNQILIKI